MVPILSQPQRPWWIFHPSSAGGCFKNTYELLNLRALNFSLWIKSTSFNVWVRYFVWNPHSTPPPPPSHPPPLPHPPTSTRPQWVKGFRGIYWFQIYLHSNSLIRPYFIPMYNEDFMRFYNTDEISAQLSARWVLDYSSLLCFTWCVNIHWGLWSYLP